MTPSGPNELASSEPNPHADSDGSSGIRLIAGIIAMLAGGMFLLGGSVLWAEENADHSPVAARH
jgi:hypothetical protein